MEDFENQADELEGEIKRNLRNSRVYVYCFFLHQ